MKKLLDDINDNKIWYCPLPFNHIYSNSDGSWMPCCHSTITKNSDNKKLNTSNTAMLDWWKSDTMNNIRNEMLGKTTSTKATDHYCYKCKNQESDGVKSTRMDWSDTITKRLDQQHARNTLIATDAYNDYNEMDLKNNDARFLELKLRIFGNLCNLSCYMCWPTNSTVRINDISKMSKETQFDWFRDSTDIKIKKPKLIAKVNADQFAKSLEQIKQISHLISIIKITGGEPMIMDSHYKLLDALIESGDAKHIQLNYQTNLTKFSRGEEVFFKSMKEFNYIHLSISIDSVGEYDEYIRKNGNTKIVDANIEKLKGHSNVSIGISNTVSMLSVLQHMQFNKKYSKFNPHYFVLTQPTHLNIKHLPDKIKDKLLTEINNEHIVNMLKQPRDDKEFQKAIKYCLELDLLYKRKRGVFDLWPELEEYYK
jgi:organic radical activating enzyme